MQVGVGNQLPGQSHQGPAVLHPADVVVDLPRDESNEEGDQFLDAGVPPDGREGRFDLRRVAPLDRQGDAGEVQAKLLGQETGQQLSDRNAAGTSTGGGGGSSGTPAKETSHNKKWEESYKELVEFKVKNGHTLVPVNKQEQTKLSRWVSRQRLEYRYMTEGKPTAMNEERFNKLSQIGFAFKAWEAKRVATMTGAPGGDPGFGLPTTRAGTAPAIAQSAQEAAATSHAAAAAASKAGATPAAAAAAAAAAAPYMYALPPTMAAARRAAAPTPGAAAAAPNQPLPPGPIPHPVTYTFPPGTMFPNSFYTMHLGSKTQKFAVTFDINLRYLIAYKEEHGSADVPGNHPTLGKWVQQMRTLCKKKAKGEKMDPLTEDQYTRLMDAGFVLQARKGPKGPRAAPKFASGGAKDDGGAADAAWDAMYTQLREFKDKEGHTNVPAKQSILRNWVMKQKKEYERLRKNEPSHLTARQVQMLNDLKMNWEIKTTLKWSERFEQLKAFKQKHTHCIVPRNYDEENMEGLGKWIAQQRHAYRLLKDGKPTTMTAERVQQFNDLGMVWSILKQSTKPRAERKSWQERFEELLAYKEEKGTTSVPQSYPGGLGNFVHQQRTMYQKYKAGKKSMMNAEKEKKLRDIGFMFSVKKGKIRENKSDVDIAIDRAEKAGALVKTSAGYAPTAASGGDSNDLPPLPAAEVDGGVGGGSEYESTNEEEAVMM
mmetsp:Transcript_33143/g.97763  ORF Transcript_33143/g.97763 Transcript_33143/m.97763 type:complete len:713 (-) Transcript_33143:38-2176(-)